MSTCYRNLLGAFGLLVLLAPGIAIGTDEAWLPALRDGGHVIYFRHARTDWSQSDRDRSRLDDCATQRNLSAEGREQSRAIGAAFEALDIPVGRVLSSAYCRCTEMASLAFGEFRVSEAVTSVFLQDQALREERTAALRELLTTVPAQGNTVLISHMANLSAARGVTLAEGEAAIYRPDGNGGSELVTRVRADQWPIPDNGS